MIHFQQLPEEGLAFAPPVTLRKARRTVLATLLQYVERYGKLENAC